MSEPNTLNDLRPDQALNLAKKHIKQGNYDKAKCVYNAILTKFPKNKFAQQALLSISPTNTTQSCVFLVEPKSSGTKVL